MITATTTNDKKIKVTGKTLMDVRAKLCGLLSIDGPQAITAVTDTGATIHVELYDDDQDEIVLANGKRVY